MRKSSSEVHGKNETAGQVTLSRFFCHGMQGPKVGQKTKAFDVPKRRGAHPRKTHSSMRSRLLVTKNAGLHVRSESALGSANSARK